MRNDLFFNINCRRKFHQAKATPSLLGVAGETPSHLICHHYFNQVRISSKYFPSPLCCPKHSSLRTRARTHMNTQKLTKNPKNQNPPPKQNRAHYDWNGGNCPNYGFSSLSFLFCSCHVMSNTYNSVISHLHNRVLEAHF